MMSNEENPIKQSLRKFKKKYFINLLIRGLIFLFALSLSIILVFTLAEYFGRFNSYIRAVLLFGFIAVFGTSFIYWILIPGFKLFRLHHFLSDKEASRKIGEYFPSIRDKLLNTLQLQSLSQKEQNDLIRASLEQREKALQVYQFENAISFRENIPYLKYLIIPLVFFIVIFAFIPSFIQESSGRIIHYKKEFEPQAPFTFNVINDSLYTFKNQNYSLNIKMDGRAIPEDVYVISEGRKQKMNKRDENIHTFTFKNLQKPKTFRLTAAGFKSRSYTIDIYHRPAIKTFTANLKYPSYLGKKNKTLKNTGSMTVPEGTLIEWNFETSFTDSILMGFGKEKPQPVKKTQENLFQKQKTIYQSTNYSLSLHNPRATNKEDINYFINVIKDKPPRIKVKNHKDTSLYEYVLLGGSISDDHGITGLKVFYNVNKKGNQTRPGKNNYKSFSINTKKGIKSQEFYLRWVLDSLNLSKGDNLSYYLKVWDNDGVNGFKSKRTQTFYLKVPERQKIDEKLERKSQNTENQIDKTYKKAQELQKKIKQIQNKVKGKQNLNWQDKNAIKDLIRKRNELEKSLKELRKKAQELEKERNRFKKEDKELKEKYNQLQKLMDEMMDEETREMYKKLQKLIEEEQEKGDLNKKLEDIEFKEDNLKKDIERSLELFKELKFDRKLDETIKDLKKQSENLKELSEETKEQGKKGNKEQNEKLKEEQEEINKKFENTKEDLEELKKINKSLKSPRKMEEMEEEQKSIEKQLQKAKENLNQNQKQKAGENQEKGSEKMKELSQKLSSMQSQMKKKQLKKNLGDLRDILENLIHLSFEQEEVMDKFKNINQSDPRYVELSQKQLELKDKAKVIEDSLHALAQKVFQLKSFVTRELSEMKRYMDESVESLRERHPRKAAGKQQHAMTSMNNLALMLDDVLSQMQKQLSKSMKGKQMCTKPGNNKGGKNSRMSEKQKKLNEELRKLKKGGNKSRKEISEELSKLIRQQEKIREKLKEMQEKSKNPGKTKEQIKDLSKQMEETEEDLAHKNINRELLRRQQEIMSRLLKAENALRKRDKKKERKGETADNLEQETPPEFDKYLKEKEKSIELLRTVPPALKPYYKEQVNEYFQKIEN